MKTDGEEQIAYSVVAVVNNIPGWVERAPAAEREPILP